MKIEKFLSTQNLKKQVFLPTSRFIFTLLQPNSWCIRMKFSLKNLKYVHLLHVKFYDYRSTVGLKNGDPNSKKSFLKCKISTFVWVHLKTARDQLKKTHEHLTRVHSTYPPLIWSLLEHVKVVLYHFKGQTSMPKTAIFAFFA